jgi:hypothetical protein
MIGTGRLAIAPPGCTAKSWPTAQSFGNGIGARSMGTGVTESAVTGCPSFVIVVPRGTITCRFGIIGSVTIVSTLGSSGVSKGLSAGRNVMNGSRVFWFGATSMSCVRSG